MSDTTATCVNDLSVFETLIQRVPSFHRNQLVEHLADRADENRNMPFPNLEFRKSAWQVSREPLAMICSIVMSWMAYGFSSSIGRNVSSPYIAAANPWRLSSPIPAVQSRSSATGHSMVHASKIASDLLLPPAPPHAPIARHAPNHLNGGGTPDLRYQSPAIGVPVCMVQATSPRKRTRSAHTSRPSAAIPR